MENQNQKNRIQVVFGPVTVDSVGPGLNGEVKHRAQLRQKVDKIYPSGGTHDSLTDALFNVDEFNLKQGSTYSENRVAWIDVPVGTTVEGVQQKLAGFPEARLVKHLSLNPILTEEQASAIQNGLNDLTIEKVAAKQVVKDEEENIRDYKGYLQYRVVKFATTAKEDVDSREADYAKMERAGIPKPFQMAGNDAAIIAGATKKAVTA
jgi:hypothetical protein